MRITLAILLVAACATSSRREALEPESMTASEHLAHARAHSEAAGGSPHEYPSPYGTSSYPWYYFWDPSTEHRAIAEAHRDAADQLRLSYEAACAAVPRDTAGMSPLERHARSMDPLPRGVVVHLAAEAGTPDAVLAAIRCHRAWLLLEPRASSADSPLLVQGVVFVVHAGATGIEVMIGLDDPARVPELVRRTRLAVERARARPRQAQR
jgi:hypothetical protein